MFYSIHFHHIFLESQDISSCRSEKERCLERVNWCCWLVKHVQKQGPPSTWEEILLYTQIQYLLYLSAKVSGLRYISVSKLEWQQLGEISLQSPTIVSCGWLVLYIVHECSSCTNLVPGGASGGNFDWRLEFWIRLDFGTFWVSLGWVEFIVGFG